MFSMVKLCNDGKCPRTRAGEGDHTYHKILKKEFHLAGFFVGMGIIIATSLLTSVLLPHLDHDQIVFLYSGYLASFIGFAGIWYAWTSNKRLERYVDWARFVQQGTTMIKSGKMQE